MITPIYRNLSGTYFYSNNTISFNSNPFLIANNYLEIYFNNDNRITAKVISVAANNAVVDLVNTQQYDNTPVNIRCDYFSQGITGTQQPFTFSFTNFPSAIIQANSTNAGNSYLSLEVSTDKLHWISLANINVFSNTNNTAYTTVTNPWPYGRINFTSIDTNTSIYINKAT